MRVEAAAGAHRRPSSRALVAAARRRRRRRMSTRAFAALARRRGRRRASSSYEVEAGDGHGRARRGARDPAHEGAGPRGPLELQGGQVRLVRRRGQRQAAPDVQDAAGRPARRRRRSTVEPMRAFPIIRDLVTDVSWNYEVNKQIPPFTPTPDADWLIGQEDVDRIAEFRKCIECFLCQDVCHVLRDHELERAVLRPALPRPDRERWRCTRSTRSTARSCVAGRRAGSASATSRSAAPRSAPRGSRSPTTRSSR